MDMTHNAGLRRKERGILDDFDKKRKINMNDAVGFFKSNCIEYNIWIWMYEK
jgi:hypothetical protein